MLFLEHGRFFVECVFIHARIIVAAVGNTIAVIVIANENSVIFLIYVQHVGNAGNGDAHLVIVGGGIHEDETLVAVANGVHAQHAPVALALLLHTIEIGLYRHPTTGFHTG